MSASLTDKITDTRNGARPNSARVSTGRTAGDTTLTCNSLTGWPTASKVHFVTYQIDTNSNVVAGTQIDAYGIVSGDTITNMTITDGVDVGNAVNDVVEMLPTAGWGQDLSDALTLEHDRTGAHTSALVTTLKATILAEVYPVGSIYTNATVSTNPATLLGFGTWSAFGDGRVLVGNGTSDQAFAAGATGGASTHTLTAAQMPAHTHVATYGGTLGVNANDPGFGSEVGGLGTGGSFGATGRGSAALNNTGGGGSHNNLQPYIVVYMWRRTA